MPESMWHSLVINGAVRSGVVVLHGPGQVSVTGLSVVGQEIDWSPVITVLIDVGERADALATAGNAVNPSSVPDRPSFLLPSHKGIPA